MNTIIPSSVTSIGDYAFDRMIHLISVVFPRLFGNSRQDMSKYYDWISSVKKYINEDVNERYCGSKDNRLFDLVK